MDISLGLLVIAAIYGVLYFFDSFFKTCAHYPYLKFLEGTGLQIKFFQLKWSTKAFNRTLLKWGTNHPRFISFWFYLGLYGSLLLYPFAICLLFLALYQNFGNKTLDETNVLEPVIPGLNLPVSELGYYSAALLLCSIVHELGHALAAVEEDVNVNYVGANILFILPIAYVNLSTEKLFSINKWKTLKILCAGVWNNLFLTFVAFFLYISLPSLFSIFYYTGKGVTISNIAKLSPLLGDKGLYIGDTIIEINNCVITDENMWYECLHKIRQHKPAFCLNGDLIHDLDESVPLIHLENDILGCCDTSKPHNFCFEYLDSKDGVLELPSHVCLPARIVVEKSANYCSFIPHSCPSNFYCFRPILGNTTNLFKIVRINKAQVVYVGVVNDLVATIDVSSYIPKRLFTTCTVADVVSKFLKYTMVFSLGLAIINIIPCLYMDGQHITNVIAHIIFYKSYGRETSQLIAAVTTWFFTVLLILHCIYIIWTKM